MENDRIASEPNLPLNTEAKRSAVPTWMAGLDVVRRGRKWACLSAGVAKPQPPCHPPRSIQCVPATSRGLLMTSGSLRNHLRQPACGLPGQNAPGVDKDGQRSNLGESLLKASALFSSER